MAKTFGDCLKAWALGLIPEGVVCISAIHDFAEQNQRGVVDEIVFFQYGLKGTFFTVVPQLNGFDIKRDGTQSFCFFLHLVGRNKEKFSLWVDKFLNQPWTGYAMYCHSFSGNTLTR